MKTVKSQSEFKAIMKSLSNQGFSYCTSEHQMLQQKIHSLIYAENTHNMKLDIDSITRNLKLWDIDSFAEMKKAIKKHFRQFSPETRLNQAIKNLSVQSSDSFHVWNDEKQPAIDKFNAFFKDCNFDYDKALEIKNNDGASWFCKVDLSKNFVKVTYRDRSELEYVIKALFDIEIKFPYYITDRFEYGKKAEIDGLGLTFYQNGYVKIEHKEIKKLKDLLIKHNSQFRPYIIKK